MSEVQDIEAMFKQLTVTVTEMQNNWKIITS